MQNTSLLPRYWYLWLTCILLILAAVTGPRESIFIHMDRTRLSMYIWELILGMAVFIALVALLYRWLDRQNKRFPRWLKITHSTITPLFCLGAFIYIQIVNAKRQADPRSYFNFEHFRYHEEMNSGMVVFVLLFFVIQVLFFGYLLVWLFRR